MMQKILNILFLLCVTVVSATSSTHTYRKDYGLAFSWQTTDIVSTATGVLSSMDFFIQRAYYVQSVNTTVPTTATVISAGFNLSPNTTYYSYTPYINTSDFQPSAVRMSYTGQKMTANGSTASLSAYDYQIGKVTTTESTVCTIDYSHVGAVLRIEDTVTEPCSFTSAILVADAKVLPTVAFTDITNQTVTPAEFADSLSLSLDGFTVSANSTFVVYAMLPAVDLSGCNLHLELITDTGRRFSTQQFSGPKMKAGYLYEANLSGNTPSQSRIGTIAPQMGEVTAGVPTPTITTTDILTDTSYTPTIIDGILSPMTSRTTAERHYNINGTAAGAHGKGIVIIRHSDGSTRKVLR